MTIKSAIMDVIDAEAAVVEAQQLAKRSREALRNEVIGRDFTEQPVGKYQYMGKQIEIVDSWNVNPDYFNTIEITVAEKIHELTPVK